MQPQAYNGNQKYQSKNKTILIVLNHQEIKQWKEEEKPLKWGEMTDQGH